ncbi:gliding motility protein GldB-related protein [Flavobacterium soyangense]|uniref:DUF2268 domain-containing protein n=1 Tax=Flavobacterium soyangense TaxID=2023265 RepID=A0A930UEK0_9FLAO|nr:DUF2268 domain-containing putative Zn-dependent protease [Flavobacterium soyangense]MBF2709452.1 hypothetical protein [Flavobacterium soyangense]
MKKLGFITLIVFSINTIIYCQTKSVVQNIDKIADSLYSANNYNLAIKYYLKLADNSDFNNKKSSAYYNASCCLSLESKKDSAIIILKKAIKNGYNDKENLLKDTDLMNLHSEIEWKKIVATLKESDKKLNSNPKKVKFFSSDVKNFWTAYKAASKDTINKKKIFGKLYFEKASLGMIDYMGLKVSSIDKFIATTNSYPKFYATIENKTKKIKSREQEFLNSFIKLKEIYNQAKFPDVYFVIGAFTSGGTVSNNGLLIGINQYCVSKEVELTEFNFQIKSRMSEWSALPNVIAHELIHYQQDGLEKEKITLCYVVREGMADFIGELISGQNANPSLHEWAKGREKSIWAKFKNDMYLDKYDNWIANSQQSTPENFPDQGYWIGYQICKSYYENATDKKKAIDEMLNIKDYKIFLEKSKWESKIETYK